MKMKIITFALFLITLITGNIYSQEKIPGIVGSWDSEVHSRYGVGSIWQFNNNGTLDIIDAAMIDYLYVLEHDTLITVIFEHQTGESKADTSVLKITNNTLTQNQVVKGKTYVKKFERIGKTENKNKPELGTWKGINSAGQEMTYKFTSDHKLLYRVPYKKISGKYNFQGNVLTTELHNQKAEVWEIHFIGKAMTLKNNNNKTELVFKRTE